jgi:tetratricopeptide (TPR) repeat protein
VRHIFQPHGFPACVYERVLAYNQSSSSNAEQAQLQQAVAFLQQGQPEKSRALCEGLLRHNPRQPDALHILGVLAHQAGRLDDACRLITEAIAAGPRTASIHSSLGNVLQDLKQGERAVESYDRALALKPDFVEAHYRRGLALEALERREDAIAAYGRAIALNPRFAAAYYKRALALHFVAPMDAVADYDQVITLTGGYAEMHYNRANALQNVERYDDAIAGYDRAIALDTNFVAAHFNRGNALVRLGRQGDALESYRRVLRLDAGHPGARKSILWLGVANTSLGIDVPALVTQTCAAKTAQEALMLAARKTIPAFRVQHDLEQSAYLLAQGHEELRDAHEMLKALQAREPRGGNFHLSDSEIETINRARSQVLRPDVGRDVTHGLNPENDWHALEAQYLSGTPEIVVIDNLLTQPALLALRQFCLASSVWRTEYDNHYLGAVVEDGFVNPLLSRIAEEFREKMPRIFSGHPLEGLWGFKYDSKMGRGINAHADFARINLNFWVTPDEANLNPASGGLVVYDVPAPKSWSHQEYNKDVRRIYEFLAARKAGKRVIPYRCNRAVLFNSNLFHETDAIHFKDGYENRRINITYLFGRGLSVL